MYRLMARDGLKQGEVRPYDRPEIGGRSAPGGEAPKQVREVRYESLDLNHLGCYFLLVAAQEKSRAIVAEAEIEARRVIEAARQAGHQEGREGAKQDLTSALIAFGHAGQSLIVFEERLIERYAPQIVRMALDIAEKVIGRAVEAEPEIVASVLERAKREVAEARHLRIWLHPADHEILRQTSPELVKVGSDRGRTIEIVCSEEISRGGCRLETEMGVVDATLPTQIDEIHRQLLDEETGECGETRDGESKSSF